MRMRADTCPGAARSGHGDQQGEGDRGSAAALSALCAVLSPRSGRRSAHRCQHQLHRQHEGGGSPWLGNPAGESAQRRAGSRGGRAGHCATAKLRPWETSLAPSVFVPLEQAPGPQGKRGHRKEHGSHGARTGAAGRAGAAGAEGAAGGSRLLLCLPHQARAPRWQWPQGAPRIPASACPLLCPVPPGRRC